MSDKSTAGGGGGGGGRGGGVARERPRAAWLFLAGALLLGAFFALFNSLLVSKEASALSINLLSEPDNPLIAEVPALSKSESFVHAGKEMRVVWSSENETVIPLSLNSAQSFRLRIKAYFPNVTYQKSKVQVLVNGRAAWIFEPRWTGEIERISTNIPASFFTASRNTITIRTLNPGSYKIGYETMNMRNYTGLNKNFPRAYVLFDENYSVLGLAPGARPLNYALYPALVFVLWLFSANLLNYAGRGGLTGSLKIALIAYLPSAAVMLALAGYSLFSPLVLILHPEGFYLLLLAPSIVLSAYSIASLAHSRITAPEEWKKEKERKKKAGKALIERETLEKGYVSARRAASFAVRFGSFAAVFGFIASLGAAGALLIARRQAIAETMADIAYFLLVFGVILRVFDIRRE